MIITNIAIMLLRFYAVDREKSKSFNCRKPRRYVQRIVMCHDRARGTAFSSARKSIPRIPVIWVGQLKSHVTPNLPVTRVSVRSRVIYSLDIIQNGRVPGFVHRPPSYDVLYSLPVPYNGLSWRVLIILAIEMANDSDNNFQRRQCITQ